MILIRFVDKSAWLPTSLQGSLVVSFAKCTFMRDILSGESPVASLVLTS